MPVTFCPAPHNDIEPVSKPPGPLTEKSSQEILSNLRQLKHRRQVPANEIEILQSSLISRDAFKLGARPPSPSESGKGVAASGTFIPQRNGLVHTVTKAYNHHHALVLRPDDVWLSILTQFSFFVNGRGRSEELRSKFVSHKDKKELETVTVANSRKVVDFGLVAKQMTDYMQANITDPTLQRWILPSFSTTTNNDLVSASVLMMAALKNYYDYEMRVTKCGIPRVTLLGEKSDWEDILSRVAKLKEYAPETKAWYRMLQPVLRRFVRSFEPGYAESEGNLDFWQRVAHHTKGSGETYLSGWITAFCVFQNKGDWMGGDLSSCDVEPAEAPIEYNEPNYRRNSKPEKVLVLDGVHYPSISLSDLPIGFCEVPVKLDDNGDVFDATMLSGLVGTTIGDSGVENGQGKGKGDQLSPAVGWWMFTVLTPEADTVSGTDSEDEEPPAKKMRMKST